MSKYICRLCEDDGVLDPFIGEYINTVGEHIKNQHDQEYINYWVYVDGNGVRKLN